MKRSTKAISPIFATLIILAVVTVLFIPVFIWATGTSSETEESWQLSGIIATERIVIEEVNLKANINNCTIYVRNIGKTTVSVNNVLISLSNDTSSLHVYTKTAPPTLTTFPNSVIQGDLITVTISDLTFNPSSNQTYTVQVFTHRGVGDAYQVVT
jgi:flagellin-like protein